MRHFAKEDAELIWQLHRDEEVMRYTRRGRALTREESLETLLKNVNDKVWAAFEKETDEFVGWFMLRMTEFEGPELGFMILKSKWGKGITTEAAKELIKNSIDQDIYACTAPENLASQRVLEKLGFKFLKEDTGSKYFIKVKAN